jgi:hypothetical protein
VPDTIDSFEQNPEPEKSWSRFPFFADWEEKAPDPKCNERNVKDDKPERAIGRDQAGEKSGGRKSLPQATEVLLERMCGLNENHCAESEFDAKHVSRVRLNVQVLQRLQRFVTAWKFYVAFTKSETAKKYPKSADSISDRQRSH